VPTKFLERQLTGLRESIEALAAGLPYLDYSGMFADLVSSADLRDEPIHRWYFYKEAFSPQLAPLLVKMLGAGQSRTVADPFAGVATTALSLRENADIECVIGVEYSPFAHFVGKAKLDSVQLDPKRILNYIERLDDGVFCRSTYSVPSLAAFHNSEIFDAETLHLLLSVRDRIRNEPDLTSEEQSFLLLGMAAVIEDLSGAMKDGRALRILRGRKRRLQGLIPVARARKGNGVQETLANQWLAMIEDVSRVRDHPTDKRTHHIRGDARSLANLVDAAGNELLPENSVGLHLYSPPYLNFIDYTEVYKIELWLLEFVVDQKEFRTLREGTLRSHPSIQFPPRPKPSCDAEVFSTIEAITEFLVAHLARPSIGHVHSYYFADMYEALSEQFRTLEPGGAIACVVANSTFSRRSKENGTTTEAWRMPILTDVFLARLAEAVGFTDIEIWGARSLQAKNVSAGYARESIVVARKR
jgi:hypothetical protein